ncbi:transposase [Streptomyces sp. NPDC056653]|uniref:transposase n=1 Tax=Streptomyces sp. NPDC056653 TaxID=3345894 RepID=UPI0036A921AB
MDGLQERAARVEVMTGLFRFRREFYDCLTVRADALFELANAVLCGSGPVVSLAELSLEAVHRRGAMYDALASGHVNVSRLREAGREGDPPVVFVLDSGYDIVRLTWLLRVEPVRPLGRIRADRVLYGPPGKRRGQRPGHRPRHGTHIRLADPTTHPAPVQDSAGRHERFGQVHARCWSRLQPKLDRSGAWADHAGELATVGGAWSTWPSSTCRAIAPREATRWARDRRWAAGRPHR